jgi:glucosyl-3-phosphoglycerate phosphatase
VTARRVVLWRHGQTGWNAGDRFQGQTDTELDDVGRGQADAAAEELLLAVAPARIVSSDLRRAADTAGALAARTGLVVHHDRALRELHAGEWQGLLRDEIVARWPEGFAAWQRGDDVPVGGGERRSEVAQRVSTAVVAHADETPDGGTLVVASHGGALRGAMLLLLGLPMASWPTFAGLANAHWAVLERLRSGGWRLAAYNVGPPGARVGAEA